MQTKQIFIIIFMVAALAGAGVFGYLSLRSDSAEVIAPEDLDTPESILPNGTNLNFDTVNTFNETGRQFQYPAVNPSEVGLQLNELMEQ